MRTRAERRAKRNRDFISPEERSVIANLSISSGAMSKRPKRGDFSYVGDVVQIVPPDEIKLLDDEKLSGLGSLCVTRIEQIRQKSSKLQGSGEF